MGGDFDVGLIGEGTCWTEEEEDEADGLVVFGAGGAGGLGRDLDEPGGGGRLGFMKGCLGVKEVAAVEEEEVVAF